MVNTKRLVLAYVIALVVAEVYELVVYGMLLRPLHAAHPELLRPEADLPMLRMFLTGALNLALVSVFYALFARGRASRLSTGVVFGVFLGFIAAWIPQVANKLLLVNWPFYTAWAWAGLGEFLVVGIVLGLVYRE